ncbi:putative acetyltransferase [Pseudomonas syringae pv. aptata]|uniref:Putative acetyltransferase n=1 Tax=Pseudomonas syringae pv. aptata TaxID=83167 RepID=A0A3M5WW38_PSEAP|nr:putative acetyltransferase [Pseudomonas syringae pv. aptata]
MNCIVEYSDPHHRLAVIQLWKTVFNDDMPHNRPDLSIDKKRAVDDHLFFVALADDQVVGTLLAGYDGHRGWLYSVAVDPQQRGNGPPGYPAGQACRKSACGSWLREDQPADPYLQ